MFGMLAALLLGGCASLVSPDPASPHYGYPAGWALRLERALEIPPGAATVRLQYGRIVPRNGVQEHDPFCVVELTTVRSTPQILQPGRFEVWRVTRSIETVAVAASPFLKTGLLGYDSAPSFLYYKTRFHLRDPAQPKLLNMTCLWDQMAPGNRPFMRHLTLDEIRAAVGDWMALIPPKETL
jgi:hypothetical protein